MGTGLQFPVAQSPGAAPRKWRLSECSEVEALTIRLGEQSGERTASARARAPRAGPGLRREGRQGGQGAGWPLEAGRGGVRHVSERK